MKALGLMLTVSALCASANVDIDVDLDNRDMFLPEWEVEVTPGGEKVFLQGTVQQVHDQLVSLNPNWDQDFLDNELRARSYEDPTKHADFSNAIYSCAGRWEYANSSAIDDGRAQLEHIAGKPRGKAGPGACGRVSCSYNAAIWWCNDNIKPKTLKSFRSIAEGVKKIEQHCRLYFGWNRVGIFVAGQAFHRTNWSVIVRKDETC